MVAVIVDQEDGKNDERACQDAVFPAATLFKGKKTNKLDLCGEGYIYVILKKN